jgi:hypothetical protein
MGQPQTAGQQLLLVKVRHQTADEECTMKIFLIRWTMIILAWVLIAYVSGFFIHVAWGHETHLSGTGQHTLISSTPCQELSGYLFNTKERGCFLVYKPRDLEHVELHVQDNFPLDKDGACACPTVPTTEGE